MTNGVKIVGITAAAMLLYSFKKVSDYSEVIEQMEFMPVNFRKLRQSNGKLYMDFDMRFYNPTSIDFDVDTAGLISVKQIDLYDGNKLVGRAFSDIQKIELPAKTGYLITNITIEVVLLNLANILLQNGFESLPNFLAKVTVQALGSTYVLDQPLTY